MESGISRRSRAVTAKKCTKKRDAREKVVVLLNKPIAVLALPSPSSLLKLPTEAVTGTFFG